MKMLHSTAAICGLLLASLAGQQAWADVLNMAPGLTSLETVPVGNPGNASDTRYATPGYGGVSYSYNIGKYEVTAGQYCEFLNKMGGVDTYGLYNPLMWSAAEGCKIERFAGNGTPLDPYQYRVASDWANRPVNWVSYGDACRFANWLHNGQPSGWQNSSTTEDGAYGLNGAMSSAALLAVTRKGNWQWAVTSEHEWYKAAYYNPATGSYYDYPTSSNGVPSNDVLTPDGGNNANFDQSGFAIGAPYYRTLVGEFELSRSPYGTFDQGGNVKEWNEAIAYVSTRCLRGGSYGDYDDVLRASYRAGGNPTYESVGSGFRVAQIREPLVGDINRDGYVNVGDLQELVAAWNSQAGPPASSNWNASADINGDGYVNVGDLQLLVANWGRS